MARTGAALQASALLPPAAAAEGPPTFGRMFPDLPPLAAPTTQQIADLATTMRDDSEVPTTGDLEAQLDGDNRAVPSGFTYFGQFIVHDVSLDASPSPEGPVDPRTVPNSRTPALDLDNVYGKGLMGSADLYDDEGRFLLACRPPDGVTEVVEVCEPPRGADGVANYPDTRDDENIITSQLHVAFMRFHNRLVDEGASFKQARLRTQRHYQYLVLHEYLPRVVGRDRMRVRGLTNPKRLGIEFATAAFRFGHSEVRNAYQLSDLTHPVGPDGVDAALPVPVFDFANLERSLTGGRPMPTGLGIDWAYFFDFEPESDQPVFDDFGNFSRLIDTNIAPSLFVLPIPAAIAQGSNVLVFRTMTRGLAYGMPSGEDVARALKIKPIDLTPFGLDPAGFSTGTPLFYYVLAESEVVEKGARLGPVGGAIVADALLTMLRETPGSILGCKGGWEPKPYEGSDYTMGDFLMYAGAFTAEQLAEHRAPEEP
jgi:hypothetical protein